MDSRQLNHDATATAVTFVGDIHGWADRCEALLLQTVGPLVFLGDLIDRGPDAPRVLTTIRERCTRGDRCLMGNHEYMLVRALGHASTRHAGNADDFARWRSAFGGEAVMASYGVSDALGLRRALGDHLDWMAALPWVLRGADWIAVHAGLEPDIPWREQVQRLEAGWAEEDANLNAIFSKRLIVHTPSDLPPNWVVVSGHTPLPDVLIRPGRMLCDTSGGLPGRALSAVRWPDGQIYSAR